VKTAKISRLDRIARPRLYEQLVEQLIQFIEEESVGVGQLLPSERELADQLGVSRATLSQALVALEVLGVIEVHHGTGATVISRPSLAAVIRGLREHSSRLPDIIEARRTIEVKLAELAADRRTDEDMKLIDDALQSMSDEIASGARGVNGDELFHGAVTAAAHSPVLAQMMGLIHEMVLESRIESLGQPGRPQQSLKSHGNIAEAIRNRARDAAAAAMDNHLRIVSEVALLHEHDTSK
jgi:GntR family transcriptional regulator, transcriptional repressor for pyruvate dehydrogenase complex